jgi:hypothetical protein
VKTNIKAADEKKKAGKEKAVNKKTVDKRQ